MVAFVRLLLALICVIVSVLATSAFSAPASDAEQQYRLLSHYLTQYNAPFDLDGYNMYFAEPRSAKRGLGPRPLRFG